MVNDEISNVYSLLSSSQSYNYNIWPRTDDLKETFTVGFDDWENEAKWILDFFKLRLEYVSSYIEDW